MNEEARRTGIIALVLSIGGLFSTLSLGILAEFLGFSHARMLAYFAFLAFQIAGFVLGVSSREDITGKVACITSTILALGSILFLA